MSRRPLTLALPLGASALLALLGAAGALADAAPTVPSSEAPAPSAATTTVPAPAPPAGQSTPTTATPEATTVPAPEVTTVPAPEVQSRRAQPGAAVRRRSHTSGASQPPSTPSPSTNAGPQAPTPPPPSALGASMAGVPSFFINSFSIPPFLLPIYQAAGAAYGVPWQVLAAINEVETDYGRDLSVSSAGAEGWMQFLPSEWGQYGVDVNNDGFKDPYNPADAIFAAARYLKAAGAGRDIRGAVLAYNHSQAYVNSVMLRARLLGGTPPELLSAITALTEARFPVYAPSHFSDGFPSTEGPLPQTVPGTTIYSLADAPVIAVQDGRIAQISQGGPLGRSISLRDAYGNTYTYAELGTLATLYPVLEALEARGPHSPAAATTATSVFRAGSQDVYLHPMRVGVQVIAGTVLGHVGGGAQPHMVFQIRPAGTGAPLIDPKPILDGWVKLRATSAVRARARDPFAASSPTAGQALLESKRQLEGQVRRDAGVRLPACERRRIGDGQVDRRVLAALEFLAASGLRPTVSPHSCASTHPVAAGLVPQSASVDISAVNGVPVASRRGPGSVFEITVRRLLGLQGAMKPLRVSGSSGAPGIPRTVAGGAQAADIHIEFEPTTGFAGGAGDGAGRIAGVFTRGLSPRQWVALVARLGEIPDPVVGAGPSPASISDSPNGPWSVAGKAR